MRVLKLTWAVLCAAVLLDAQTAMYPAAIANDAQLATAKNNFSAKLATSVTPLSTVFSLSNQANGPANANMLLSVDREIVRVVSVSGTSITVQRGYDGTIPAAHIATSLIEARIVAWHHNALKKEVIAIEQTLGTNPTMIPSQAGQSGKFLKTDGATATWETPASADALPPQAGHDGKYLKTNGAAASWASVDAGDSLPWISVAEYAFTPQSPGGSLVAGSNSITLSPVPLGVNGTDSNHPLWVSAGSGTAEACTISGGSAVAGASSGTLTITCAGAHSGAWTIGSATAGLQEALQAAGSGKELRLNAGTYTMHAKATTTAAGVVIRGAGRDQAAVIAANGSNLATLLQVNHDNVEIRGISWDANFIAQSSGQGDAIDLYAMAHARIEDCAFMHTGRGAPATQPLSAAILIQGATDITIARNLFLSNWGYEIAFYTLDTTGQTYRGYYILDNQFGSPNITDARTNVDYWDTYSGGQYSILANGYSEMVIRGNRIFGAVKKNLLGNPIYIAHGDSIVIDQNLIEGMGNGTGTVAVSNGSGTITGSNTFFNTGAPSGSDVGAWLQVEGDTTKYQITAVSSPTSVTVTPVIVRSSASGLRYRISSTGDAIGCGSCTNVTISANIIHHSHDNGIGSGSDGFFGAPDKLGERYTIVGNVSSSNNGVGLYLGGLTHSTIAGNTFTNNGQAGSAVAAQNRAGIFIDNSSTWLQVGYNYIGNNLLSDSQTTHTQQYGLSVAGTTGTNNILGQNGCSTNAVSCVYQGGDNWVRTVFTPSDFPANQRNPPVSPHWVVGPSTNPASSTGTFGVSGGDSKHTIDIGYDSANGFGWLSAGFSGVGFQTLWLQPAGGYVALGKAIAVGSLPVCGIAAVPEGTVVPVNDSNTATFNAAVAGAGSNHVQAYCDGSTWRVH